MHSDREKRTRFRKFKIFTMNDSSGSPLLPGDSSFGRFQFVREAPEIALTSVLILTMAALVGTFGNLLILVSVCHTIKRKSLEFIFMGNLAVSDTFVTLIVDPINILGKYIYVHDVTFHKILKSRSLKIVNFPYIFISLLFLYFTF